jgi:hypothetical protein
VVSRLVLASPHIPERGCFDQAHIDVCARRVRARDRASDRAANPLGVVAKHAAAQSGQKYVARTTRTAIRIRTGTAAGICIRICICTRIRSRTRTRTRINTARTIQHAGPQCGLVRRVEHERGQRRPQRVGDTRVGAGEGGRIYLRGEELTLG